MLEEKFETHSGLFNRWNSSQVNIWIGPYIFKFQVLIHREETHMSRGMFAFKHYVTVVILNQVYCQQTHHLCVEIFLTWSQFFRWLNVHLYGWNCDLCLVFCLESWVANMEMKRRKQNGHFYSVKKIELRETVLGSGDFFNSQSMNWVSLSYKQKTFSASPFLSTRMLTFLLPSSAPYAHLHASH